MATATRPGGLYYVGGVAVDANGEVVKDAPKIGPDTPREQILGSPAAASASDPAVQTIATAIASAITQAKPASTTSAASATQSEVSAEGVTLDDLSAHISSLTAEQVRSLQKSDERKGAEPIYAARLKELEGK